MGGGDGRSKVLVRDSGSFDDGCSDDPPLGHAGASRGVVVLRVLFLLVALVQGFYGWRCGYGVEGRSSSLAWGQPSGRRFLSRYAHGGCAFRAARRGSRGGGALDLAATTSEVALVVTRALLYRMGASVPIRKAEVAWQGGGEGRRSLAAGFPWGTGGGGGCWCLWRRAWGACRACSRARSASSGRARCGSWARFPRRQRGCWRCGSLAIRSHEVPERFLQRGGDQGWREDRQGVRTNG